jgi:hypothetical protein
MPSKTRKNRFHHFFITRFSVLDVTKALDTNSPAYSETKWYLDNKTAESKESYLFNPRRLSMKWKAFTMMTAPSINNQSYKHYTWLIYTSNKLPELYKKRLETYASQKIKIIYVNDFYEMETDLTKQLHGKKHYTTIRIDDDDGLHPGFLEQINKYACFQGSIISMPYGHLYTIRNNKIIYGSKINKKCIALGLTAIGFNIYSTGIHTEVDQHYNVIYDTMQNAYSLFASKLTLTKRNFY